MIQKRTTRSGQQLGHPVRERDRRGNVLPGNRPGGLQQDHIAGVEPARLARGVAVSAPGLEIEGIPYGDGREPPVLQLLPRMVVDGDVYGLCAPRRNPGRGVQARTLPREVVVVEQDGTAVTGEHVGRECGRVGVERQ